MGCIEVLRDDQLSRVIFPVPRICSLLTAATMDEMIEVLKRHVEGGDSRRNAEKQDNDNFFTVDINV